MVGRMKISLSYDKILELGVLSQQKREAAGTGSSIRFSFSACFSRLYHPTLTSQSTGERTRLKH